MRLAYGERPLNVWLNCGIIKKQLEHRHVRAEEAASIVVRAGEGGDRDY